MSGGHFAYENQAIGFRIEDIICDDKDFSKLKEILIKLNRLLFAHRSALYEIDYHYSGDSHINDLKQFEKQVLKEIKELADDISI